MLKSMLLVITALIAVVGAESACANEPQDDSACGAASVEAAAEPKLASGDDVVVLQTIQQQKPRFENIARNVTPEDRWLREMLSKPVPTLDFPGETSLSEILDTISSNYTTKFGAGAGSDGGDFRMTFYPDYAELELEGITSLEDVAVRDISFEGLQLHNALQLIFDQTTDPQLTFAIENQVMKVTTRAKADSEDNLCTRVYNVGELANLRFAADRLSRLRTKGHPIDDPNVAPKKGGVGFFSVRPQVSSGKVASGGATTPTSGAAPKLKMEPNISALESLLMEMTTPPAKWYAVDGEGGSMRLVGQTLFVRQTHAIQDLIVMQLNILDTDSAYHTRIYKVGELAKLRFSEDEFPRDRVSSGESLPNAIQKTNLETLIVEMTGGEWSDSEGEGGTIRQIDTNLVIRQTTAVHTQIVDLLELLSKMKASADSGS